MESKDCHHTHLPWLGVVVVTILFRVACQVDRLILHKADCPYQRLVQQPAAYKGATGRRGREWDRGTPLVADCNDCRNCKMTLLQY